MQESVGATGGDPNVRFASSTRDTAFVFPSSRSKLAVDRLDNDLTIAMHCPVTAAPPAEPNVAYTQFLSRLRQELIACDHLVPVQRADAVTMLAVLLLEKQHDRLLAAICSLFPRVNSQSSQDQDIQWIQGNRVCQFNENGSKQGLMLSSCTRYTLFLPKAGYLITSVQACDLQAAVAIALRLHNPTQPRSDAHAVTGTENGYQTPETPGTQTKGKEEGFTATNFSPPIVQLPEILNSFQLAPKQILRVSKTLRWAGGTLTRAGELSARKGSHEEAPFRWRDVVAGDNWSMALSEDGRVWSWGACGGAVLGHGVGGTQNNALLAETILQRHQRLLAQRQKPAATTATACPALPRFKWMTPQVIPCFSTSDTRICRLSAGVQHAAAISATGDLYLWGEGYTSSDDVEGSAMLSSLPKLVNSGQRVEEEAGGDDDADIGTHSVEHVVCGGRQVVAFTSGSFLARSMHHLYHESLARRDVNKSHRTSSIADPDIVLIVSGQRLAAHKLLLARRSPVLRELILDEEQQQNQLVRNETDGESTPSSTISSPMELLLPQLRVDVARALVEFIYTDNLSPDLNPQGSSYLIRDVLRAARIYKVPSLAQICRERLFSVSPSSLFEIPVELEEEGEGEEDEAFALEDRAFNDDDEDSIPTAGAARTLNDDMKLALSDTAWTDAILVAEGRTIPVHRCMLVARSEYFRAVFAFQNASTHAVDGVHGSGEPTVVNVEDSYDGLVRVLHFIYHDQVTLPLAKSKSEAYRGKEDSDDGEEAEDASDQLLEDLLAADKYGLDRMKRLCEHAVCVTAANCLEVLAVAELVHAAHLKQVAMRFVQTHLAAVTARQAEFKRFQTDFPQLLQELYTSIRDASRDEFLLRLQYNTKSAAAPFPWVPLSLALAFGTLYLSMMHAQEHEYPMVPATNIAALAAIAGAIMFGWI
ncbi:hypothetical protein BBJ28_00004197 [Nothophytophthora sp. Chile5]|nr:hypothetical protein BBJ28_00004197 [Nothophytophthora sp. Chile5]